MSFEFEARFFCSLLSRSGMRPRRVLVVGCGDGVEAGHIAHETGAAVAGLDLVVEGRFRRPGVELMKSDARALPFRDDTFDALYCYHVLEHVPGPERAVTECRRVLAPGGIAFFGTPNRSRIAGYIGGRATFAQKIQWNLADWGRRVTGKWSNELGAHAGFSDGEMTRLLRASFEHVECVNVNYYVGKYPKLRSLWETSYRLGLGRFLAPSVYYCARGSELAPKR
jgi:SAM-dependent methyltransferase